MDNDSGLHRLKTSGFEGRQRWWQDQAHLALQRAEKLFRMQTRDGRLIVAVLVLSFGLGLSALGNVMQGLSGIREVVQLVYIDQLGNEQRAVRLDQLPSTPDQLQIVEILMTWAKMVRTITPAGRVMNDMWDWLRDYSAPALMTRLEPYRKEQMQRQQTGVQVHITKPTWQRLAGARSFYLEWDECTTGLDGRLVVEQSAVWKATFLVADFQSEAVKKARDLRVKNKVYRNLLGIVVEDVEWKAQPMLNLKIAEDRCAKS